MDVLPEAETIVAIEFSACADQTMCSTLPFFHQETKFFCSCLAVGWKPTPIRFSCCVAVKMPTPSLSLCPECATAVTATTVVSDAVGECIQCGQNFLLPLTSLLVEKRTLTVAPSVIAEPSDGPVRRSSTVGRMLLAVLVSLVVNGGLLIILGLLYFRVANYEAFLINGKLNSGQQNDIAIFPVFELGGAELEQDRLQPAMEIARMTPTNDGRFPVSDGSLPAGIGALGGGDGTGSGGVGTGMFNGVRDGESFAYVVDASGSMSGNRMKRVLEELQGSVNSLAETHRFFVVFFNKNTYAMMWPNIEKRLVIADRRNKDRVLGWAFTVQPQEVTEPQRALRMALDLKPDIVFFLTDGDIPEETLRIVKKYRSRGTSVHTICVGEDAAVPVMQKIAEVGQGKFLMVQ